MTDTISLYHNVAEWLRALDSSSGVSDQQSVSLSPGQGSVVLQKDTLPYDLRCPLMIGSAR